MNRSLIRSSFAVLMTLGITALSACAPTDESGAGGSGSGSSAKSGAASTATSGSGSGTNSGPASSSGSGNPGSTLGPAVTKDATLSGVIDMPATTTIAVGVTLTLSPGTTILAGKDALLITKGTLLANGTVAAPVVFESKAKAAPGDWGGLEVGKGGNAKITHAQVHHAAIAFQADAGSMYTVDYILVDTSSKILELDADGTFGHGQLHALGMAQGQDAITVASASPKVSDTLLDNGKSDTDHINVNGPASAPVFDHMEVANCHCAFHFNEGAGVTITNSYIHDSAYGMMILGAVGTKVQGNNFQKNTTNIGDCGGGSAVATGNYYDTAAFDVSCKGQTNTSPSASPIPNVGPRP